MLKAYNSVLLKDNADISNNMTNNTNPKNSVFFCSHTVLHKKYSLGVIFSSSLCSCYAVNFLNNHCISLLIVLGMIVYVTNKPTLNLEK